MKAVIYARYSSDNQREEALFSLYRNRVRPSQILCKPPKQGVK